MDTDVMLPDKLNTFFAHFEDNTVPPSRPANKVCALKNRYLSCFSLGERAISVPVDQATARVFTRGCVYIEDRSRPLAAFITRGVYGSSD
jgi:hypothetical protein